LGTHGGILYAGGDFTNAAGIAEADFVAAWDGANWSALGDNGAGDGAFDSPSDHVYALAVDSTGKVYAGGNFNDVNNGSVNMPDADFFVMWNGSAWSAVGTNGVSPSIGQPDTIVIDDSDNVYVGGYFTNVNNKGTTIPTADKIAKWDGSDWSGFGSNGSGDGSINKPSNSSFGVFAIGLDGSNMYVGGYFEDVSNEGTLLPFSDHFVLWNTDHWEAVGSGSNGPIQNSSAPLINAIAVMGTDVYVGGSFTDMGNAMGINNINLDNIARWDGSQWNTVGSGVSSTVYALRVDGSDLYVGGSFQNAGGNASADFLAKWNGVAWSAVGSNGAGNGSLSSTVYALAMFNSELYVGGSFTNVVDVDTVVLDEADYIAHWNGSHWQPVNNGSGTPIGNNVFALEPTGSGLYVGGSFVNANGIAEADAVAKWDGADWSALGNNGVGVGVISSGTVYALKQVGLDLYVGGAFQNVAGISQADYMVKWDGTNWTALGSNLAGTNGSINSTVRAIAYFGTNLYVGGDFTNVSDAGGDLPAADYLARWNGTHWSALSDNGSGNGSLNNSVITLAMVDALYVGGKFADLNNNGVEIPEADYIAVYGIPSIQLPPSWVGGLSVTSDKQVVAVGRPHIGNEIAAYDGFASGSLNAYVPMLFRDAFGGSYDSALYVQNVHATNTANVTIKYYDNNGVLNCTKADTIAPLASKGYWLPSVTCDSGSLPTGWVGGVKIESDQPIVAVGRPHIGAEVMTYNGFAAGDTSTYIPMLFKGAFGGSYNAAFYVQNVDESNTANVTIKYYDSNGVLNCTKADTISPLASKGYWVPFATCDSGSLPAGWVGGVKVESDQPIVGVGRPHIGTQITTYDGFAAGDTSTYIPMLFKGAFGGSYNAAFYVQNVHASNTANVTIKYYDSAGSLKCTKADTIAPLASKGYWVPAATCDSGSLPAGWSGGVVVTSDQPIVGVGRPHIGTQVLTYNGFTAGSVNSYLPMLFKNAFGGSYNAAFYVQNTENSAATVTIKFYDSNGNLSCARTDTIPALSTLGFWIPSVTCVL